eukprot:5743603-Pyramimonas_sp.AAC.1
MNDSSSPSPCNRRSRVALTYCALPNSAPPPLLPALTCLKEEPLFCHHTPRAWVHMGLDRDAPIICHWATCAACRCGSQESLALFVLRIGGAHHVQFIPPPHEPAKIAQLPQ